MAGKLDVVIWGAGNLGEQVQYILSYNPEIGVRAFLDDDESLVGGTLHVVPILKPGTTTVRTLRDQGVSHGIVATGSGRVREELSHRLEDWGFEIISAIHPTAHIPPQARLGKGTIICPGVNLFYNPVIGNFVYLGPSVTVNHDNLIEDNVNLSGGCITGARVHIHKNAFVGIGATVVPKDFGSLSVGEDAVVGTGAVVVKDVPNRAVVVGVPARIIRYRTVESEAPASGR